ncbi:MAG TPA: ATP-binding protein [Gemmatimonadaceae bacterium]|nr:ATP-binding protein [Gemmatimonadaceae bacterium]
MTVRCDCTGHHPRRRIVLTGGPGAGKTAVLQLLKHALCEHVLILPESAGMLFSGGFPRDGDLEVRRAGQRAIFYVQRELETAADAAHPALVICDRGMIDGYAYWPGPEAFWNALGVEREELFARYAAVIHLRTPGPEHGYNETAVRVESAHVAAEIDQKLLEAWAGHPHRYVVESCDNFLDKAAKAVEIIRAQVPSCCRVAAVHLTPGQHAHAAAMR